MRVGIYARVSTTGHGQQVGLQLEELRQIARHRDWQIVGEFVDDGVSGVTVSRPGLDALLDAAKRGKLDLVAVWKIDRLGRSLQHLLQILDELRTLNVGFVSARDAGLDSTSASGTLMLHVLGAFSAYEAAVIKERVIAGVRRAQAKGTHCGRPRVEMDLRPALALLDRGHGLKRISSMLNVSRTTLRERLREAGHWPVHLGVDNPTPEEAP